MYNALLNLSSKFDIAKVDYSSSIPHLNIVGIVGYDKQRKVNLYVELVDDLLKVQNKEVTPHGLMSLKLRMLKKLGKTILIVRI